ncbi:MAG: hypothetical protein JXR96_26070 [Deltaproteobacteria bacterium]|nr:hypothetical protein [Deltaproteobacteria bacterium]
MPEQPEPAEAAAELEDSDAARAEQAARSLWLIARQGGDLGAVRAQLDRATHRAEGNIAFFASLALSHHCRRTGEPPLPIAEPNEPPADISAVTWTGSSYSYRCGHEPFHEGPDSSEKRSKRACGVCGSDRTRCVHSDGYGSVAGGYDCEEYLCSECGKYTLYEHEWG